MEPQKFDIGAANPGVGTRVTSGSVCLDHRSGVVVMECGRYAESRGAGCYGESRWEAMEARGPQRRPRTVRQCEAVKLQPHC